MDFKTINCYVFEFYPPSSPRATPSYYDNGILPRQFDKDLLESFKVPLPYYMFALAEKGKTKQGYTRR